MTPEGLGRVVRAVRNRSRGVRCTVCSNYSPAFLPHGADARLGARCPCCRALERHRLLWLGLGQRTSLFEGGVARMLHVAPEPFLRDRLRSHPQQYVSVDLSKRDPSVLGDLTALPFAASSFDLVLCLHVLEHVADDAAAIAELRRVTADDGIAVINVPVRWDLAATDEEVLSDPSERAARYGQEDHVRQYGPDVVDRLRQGGFDVERLRGPALSRRPGRLGLLDGDELELCRPRPGCR